MSTGRQTRRRRRNERVSRDHSECVMLANPATRQPQAYLMLPSTRPPVPGQCADPRLYFSIVTEPTTVPPPRRPAQPSAAVLTPAASTVVQSLNPFKTLQRHR